MTDNPSSLCPDARRLPSGGWDEEGSWGRQEAGVLVRVGRMWGGEETRDKAVLEGGLPALPRCDPDPYICKVGGDL